MPADNNYHSLWSLVTALTGWNPANALIPDRGNFLILGSDSGTIYVSDSNNANVAGMPILSGGSLTLPGYNGTQICLQEIFIKGNGLLISGWYGW